ncbi:efflux RND transporter periplasmic adaptor subunit [Litorivivens sp.]|uniref:efflux RND transporter periplasmic adaptor subunit n=1 Tax=Litorivivens sp. TaxID=2020868 RepID=UPI003569C5EF
MKSPVAKRWLVTATSLSVVIAALAAFKVQEILGAIAFAQSFPEPAEKVEVYVVASGDYQAMQTVYAEVTAPQRLTLRNELGGVIVKLGFAAGDRVSEGQLLVQQDVREEQARLRALKARDVLAARTFERNSTLFREKRLSEQALDEARAELESVRAEIAQVTVQIDKKTLRAPFAAKAGMHRLEVGELLTPHTAITTLVGEGETRWIDFELPQAAMQLQVGDPVAVMAERELTAHIIARDAQLSESARSLCYRAELTAADHGLLPNAVVKVRVPASRPQVVALIPDTALRVDQLGSFVYLLEQGEDNVLRARRQQVEVASRRNNTVAIAAGVSEGDRIAGKGAFKLRDNMKVSVAEPAAEPHS